jgi:hypothetical protein
VVRQRHAGRVASGCLLRDHRVRETRLASLLCVLPKGISLVPLHNAVGEEEQHGGEDAERNVNARHLEDVAAEVDDDGCVKVVRA